MEDIGLKIRLEADSTGLSETFAKISTGAKKAASDVGSSLTPALDKLGKTITGLKPVDIKVNKPAPVKVDVSVADFKVPDVNPV